MEETIKVHVAKYPDRDNLVMRYVDPTTGRQVTRSAKTKNQREAERAAAKWEAELRDGRYQKPQRMTWAEFRLHHEQHVLDGMKATTAIAYDATMNIWQRLAAPARLADCTTERITAFATAMRSAGRTPATVARHLRHLKAVLRWAHGQGLLHKLPRFDMPKGAKGMKGRPISGEEFDRLLRAVPRALEARPTVGGADAVTPLRFYLRGLWASGLRLEESLALRWDDAAGAIVVDLGGRRPMLRIPAESEKGNTHRLPITPEFAALLAEVPAADRHGRVFKLVRHDGTPCPASRFVVGPIVSAIGKAAGVVVAEKPAKGDATPVRKYASAHDLRRSFGFRWSRRVMPTILRELMRHESIETTMTYYVGQNAEATADALWASVGNIPGNSVATTEKAVAVSR